MYLASRSVANNVRRPIALQRVLRVSRDSSISISRLVLVCRLSTTTSATTTTSLSSSPKRLLLKPIRRTVTPEERAALRAARKDGSLQQQATTNTSESGRNAAATTAAVAQSQQSKVAAAVDANTIAGTSKSTSSFTKLFSSRWIRYLGFVGVPTTLLAVGLQYPDSYPAQFSRYIGLTAFIRQYTDEISKPVNDKLIPAFYDMPGVPQDIPIPPTLVLDLENTLVSATWDRKHGWRYAKRPGVDQFLETMAQYYEIVLYSPSTQGLAEEVVAKLDKNRAIMHYLFRDATHFHNGVHVKDLKRLDRNLNRMIVIDDDPAEVQFNPENLIRVKPYADPTDREDRTLTRLIPFLVSIAREGVSDVPAFLRQYEGLDADEMVDEYERRVRQFEQDRFRRHRAGGFSRFVHGRGQSEDSSTNGLEGMSMYDFKSPSSASKQSITARDIVGNAPADGLDDTGDNIRGWINRRNQAKQEMQQRKIERWNAAYTKKQQEQQEKRAQAKQD